MTALAIWTVIQRIGASALSFLKTLSAWQLLCIALALFGAVQTMRLTAERHHSAKVEAQLGKCTAARHADQQAYAKAQAEAQAQNKAHVQKIEQQYQRNSDNERQAYLSDRAKLIAYYDGLRAKAAPGASRAAPSSPDRTAAPGADGNGLPVPPTLDLQTEQDAAEIELRLLHLQQYVEGLLSINPNTEASGK